MDIGLQGIYFFSRMLRVYLLLFQSAVCRTISQLTSQIASIVQAKLNTLPHTKGTITPAEIVENSI